VAKRKEGHKIVFVEVPEDLAGRLKRVAKLNDRSMTAEAVRAFRRHVEAEEKALGLAPPGVKRRGRQ
jgi:hypothetical protein